MMHILLITNLFPNPVEPNRGVFVADMAEQLKRHCDLTIMSPLPWFPHVRLLRRLKRWYKFSLVPDEARVNGFQVRYPKFLAIPKCDFLHGVFLFASLLPAVWRVHRVKRVDMINAHWVFPDGVAACWVGRLLRIPVVVSAHGCDINAYTRSPLRRLQITGALRAAERVTVVSAAQQQRIQALGVRNGKTQVIQNGVDQTQYRHRNKQTLQRQLGIRGDRQVILFVGQFVDVKGFAYLIQAARILKARVGERFQVVAVGDGPLREANMGEVAGQGLHGQFVFCGEKPHEEIALWMGACDLLCLPSLSEGCPTVVIEALACGRPVVASRVGGIPELVHDGNGVLCAPGDPRGLAEALQGALERTWDPEAIQASARHLSWDATARRYFETIQEAVVASGRQT